MLHVQLQWWLEIFALFAIKGKSFHPERYYLENDSVAYSKINKIGNSSQLGGRLFPLVTMGIHRFRLHLGQAAQVAFLSSYV